MSRGPLNYWVQFRVPRGAWATCCCGTLRYPGTRMRDARRAP